MSFEQTRDILEKARLFHHELRAFYSRMEETAQRDRIRMLLEYLGRREAHLEERLAEYERNASRDMLDQWFRFAPAQHIGEEISRVRLRPDPTPEELIAVALKLDEELLRIYRQAAELAPDDAVRELFTRLFEEGKQERSNLVLSVFEPI